MRQYLYHAKIKVKMLFFVGIGVLFTSWSRNATSLWGTCNEILSCHHSLERIVCCCLISGCIVTDAMYKGVVINHIVVNARKELLNHKKWSNWKLQTKVVAIFVFMTKTIVPVLILLSTMKVFMLPCIAYNLIHMLSRRSGALKTWPLTRFWWLQWKAR